MKKVKAALCLLAIMGVMPLTAVAQDTTATDAHEASLMHSAELFIISNMARELSRSARETHEKLLQTCPETETELCKAACSNPLGSGGAVEFIIDLIGFARSDVAANTLVNLLALRLDGAGSEGLSCQIIIRGRTILSRLERLQAKPLVEHCQSTFNELRKRELKGISDVKVEQICRTEEKIRSERDLYIEAIKSNAKCEL